MTQKVEKEFINIINKIDNLLENEMFVIKLILMLFVLNNYGDAARLDLNEISIEWTYGSQSIDFTVTATLAVPLNAGKFFKN